MPDQTTTIEARTDHTPTPLVKQIDQVMPQLERLGVQPQRFARVLLTQVRANPKLLQCTPDSFMAAAFHSAQLGLEPGPLEQVWFIPRRNKKAGTTEVQWMIGFRGMVELARRAGVIVTVGTVHRNDRFEEHKGTAPKIIHEPNHADPGEPYLWYAVAQWPDGRTVHRVLTKDQVEERRKKSSTPYKPGAPWFDHYDAMGRKTAVRALWAELPTDPQIQEAARIDEQVLSMPAVSSGDQQPPELDAGTDVDAGEVVEGAATTDAADPIDEASVHELREECRRLGVSRQGSRAELIARIVAARETADDAPDEPEPPTASDVLPDPPKRGMSKIRRRLFAVLTEHGITDDQRKAVLRHHYKVGSLNDLDDKAVAQLVAAIEAEGGAENFKLVANEWLASEQDHESDDDRDDDDIADEDQDDEPTEESPGPSLAERAHAHAEGQSDAVAGYQARIREAWRVLAVANETVYQGGWERAEKITGGRAGSSDWSGSSEAALRALAVDMERAAAEAGDG